MVSLKGLPDALKGVAWPSSARTLRRAVKSVNEQDPHYQLLLFFPKDKHSDGTATDKVEEGVGYDRSVWP